MRKAQTEMIIIVGVILLAAVAILYATQQFFPFNPVPSGVAQTQKAVKDSFLTLAKNSAERTLRIMFEHGGYLSPEVLQEPFTIPESTVFSGMGVPYWTKCEADVSPSKEEVTSWMETAITLSLEKNIDSLQASFSKDVSFDISKLRVDAIVLDNKVDVTINLPTVVEGYSLQQPYTLSIPTKFGRIFSFAEDFTQEAISTRLLEYNTLASLYFSPLAPDGEPRVPTYGFLQDCGQTLYRTPEDISRGVKDSVFYTLASTLWWKPRPLDQSQAQVYSIPLVNGKAYTDLSPTFHLPDDFNFRFTSPIIFSNNKFDYSSIGPFFTFTCFLGYVQKYSIDFPVILQVKDDLTGYIFSFASFVHIVDPGGENHMTPGSCTSLSTSSSCTDLACNAHITVRDLNGQPVKNVRAYYQDCNIGTSDSNGIITGPVSCGSSGKLSLTPPEGYSYVTFDTDSASLERATITVPRTPTINVHFFTIDRDCSISSVKEELLSFTFSSSQQYPLTNIDPSSPSTVSCTEENPRECLQNLEGGILSSTTASFIPAGEYSVQGWLMNPSQIPYFPQQDYLPFITLPSTTISIPDQESATMRITVPYSTYYFSEASRCLAGETAPWSQCSPEIKLCTDTCGDLESLTTRYEWVNDYFSNEFQSRFTETLDRCGVRMIDTA